MKDYENQISQFNDAVLEIQRLHNIWLAARMYREKGLLRDVIWILDSGEIELSDAIDRLKEKNNIDYKKQIDILNEKINKANLDKNNLELYKHLIEKERILRKVQQDSGKGTKWKDSDEDEMD